MTLDDMIAVLKAAKRGEKIQCKALYDDMQTRLQSWNDISYKDEDDWNFEDFEYRVAPVIPAGMVLVPVEPTEAMLNVVIENYRPNIAVKEMIYKAMIAAAQGEKP